VVFGGTELFLVVTEWSRWSKESPMVKSNLEWYLVVHHGSVWVVQSGPGDPE